MQGEHSTMEKTSSAMPHRPKLLRDSAYVAGQWIKGTAEPICVLNPADGSQVGTVPDLGIADMRQAIDRASVALGPWKGLLPRQRSDLLMAWYEQIIAHKADLAELMTLEQGKPLADAMGEIEYAAGFVRWFAEEANRVYGEVIPSHLPHRKMLVQREALGVVGLVTPWNFPSAMITRKAAAALAAGCTAITVPSTETPFSALALAGLAEAAGIPAGVFSVLTGDPKALVGELCRNEKIRGLSFTGSTSVGRLLAAQCAPTLKRLSMELGGHAPFIVFKDADIQVAAQVAVAAKFQTSGQDCLAANRIFVHRDVLSQFTDIFVAETRKLRVGEGHEEGIDIGPLINGATIAKSAEHIADAIAKGASVVEGGTPHPRGGLFFTPTVLVGITQDMKIMSEETFGPVAAIIPFDDEDEVVQMANATEYGLAAYVFTRDLSRALRVTDALEYGMVAINTMKMTGPPIPFGGIKQSGLGREGSRHGIDEYTEMKYVCIDLTHSSN
jgi:aspartate-semialdehyde dehydrogenase